jgi:hypothetical protein
VAENFLHHTRERGRRQIAARQPTAALGRCGCIQDRGETGIGALHGELEMEMGEGVFHHTANFIPIRGDRPISAGIPTRRIAIGPRRCRDFEHSAKQAFERPLAQQHRAVLAYGHKGGAAANWPYTLLGAIGQDIGKAFGIGATVGT